MVGLAAAADAIPPSTSALKKLFLMGVLMLQAITNLSDLTTTLLIKVSEAILTCLCDSPVNRIATYPCPLHSYIPANYT